MQTSWKSSVSVQEVFANFFVGEYTVFIAVILICFVIILGGRSTLTTPYPLRLPQPPSPSHVHLRSCVISSKSNGAGRCRSRHSGSSENDPRSNGPFKWTFSRWFEKRNRRRLEHSGRDGCETENEFGSDAEIGSGCSGRITAELVVGTGDGQTEIEQP